MCFKVVSSGLRKSICWETPWREMGELRNPCGVGEFNKSKVHHRPSRWFMGFDLAVANNTKSRNYIKIINMYKEQVKICRFSC